MASMTGAKIRLPSGTVPPNAMNHSAITRPRSLSSSLLWRIVLIEVVVEK